MIQHFQICIFEDLIGSNLTPYHHTRPCYTIPTGYYNLIEKITNFCPDIPLTLLCHPKQLPFIKKKYPKIQVNRLNKSLPSLYINGRVNFSHKQFNELLTSITSEKNYVFIKEHDILAVYCQDETNEPLFNQLCKQSDFSDIIQLTRNKSITENKQHIQIQTHWWDYLLQLEKNLTMDFKDCHKKGIIEGDISTSVMLINEHDMTIDKLANISEFSSLDATNGPIFISPNVLIKPFVHIEGPCYIGSNTTINSHASIAASFIGNHCKIGGEIKRSICQSYSNKAHYGFLGDSIVGEWCNLGAGTTTSNLKLSYGNITSYNPNPVKSIETQQQFLGSIFGDYVKTSIQSSFECGSVISSATSLFGSKSHAKFIPPFTWGTQDDYQQQQLTPFIESIDRMMKRRDTSLSEEEKIAFKAFHENAI